MALSDTPSRLACARQNSRLKRSMGRVVYADSHRVNCALYNLDNLVSKRHVHIVAATADNIPAIRRYAASDRSRSSSSRALRRSTAT